MATIIGKRFPALIIVWSKNASVSNVISFANILTQKPPNPKGGNAALSKQISKKGGDDRRNKYCQLAEINKNQ